MFLFSLSIPENGISTFRTVLGIINRLQLRQFLYLQRLIKQWRGRLGISSISPSVYFAFNCEKKSRLILINRRFFDLDVRNGKQHKTFETCV